ncbi:hypothetical protein L6Q79_16140 [bacterium]|nr:hypothetical protein [bacterium]
MWSGCAQIIAIKQSCTDSEITTHISSKEFYSLTQEANRTLWFKEIGLPCASSITPLWDDYHQNNYRAAGKDFIDYFSSDTSILYAAQFGPNLDLWAFTSYVARPFRDSVLLVHSYFRHARFTYKSYALISLSVSDSLHSLFLNLQKYEPDSSWEDADFSGFIIEGRTRFSFIVDLSKAYHYVDVDSVRKKRVTNDEVTSLNSFLDNSIKWKTTYNH